MKSVIASLAAAGLLALLPAPASAAADVIAFTKRINTISAFLAAKEICQAAGYTYAPHAIENTISPAIAGAVKDGMTESMAHGMMTEALQAAADREVALWQGFAERSAAAANRGDGPGVLANADAMYDSVDAKCRGFAGSAEFKPFITAPENGGYRHFLEYLAAWADAK